MSRDISNAEDVIDSRDVIERIEELESERRPWVAGWNTPGYMPDNEPANFECFEDAVNYIADALEEIADYEHQNESPDIGLVAETDAVKARILAMADKEPAEYGETIGNHHYWISRADREGLPETEYDELRALRSLAAEASGYAADWEIGEILIRDSYFKEYAQEWAEDIGVINHDATWPNNCIDWEQAARELQMDYTAVDFDGVTYWVR